MSYWLCTPRTLHKTSQALGAGSIPIAKVMLLRASATSLTGARWGIAVSAWGPNLAARIASRFDPNPEKIDTVAAFVSRRREPRDHGLGGAD